jgi:hypothetical protein
MFTKTSEFIQDIVKCFAYMDTFCYNSISLKFIFTYATCKTKYKSKNYMPTQTHQRRNKKL